MDNDTLTQRAYSLWRGSHKAGEMPPHWKDLSDHMRLTLAGVVQASRVLPK